MTIESRVKHLEEKHNLSHQELIVFITDFNTDWNTGRIERSNETLSPKKLLVWQNEVKKRVDGEIVKQRAEGKTCIVVLEVPYGYNEKG